MRIGRHMPTNSKPLKAAQIAHDIGCDAIQIFASNPTGWSPSGDDPDSCTQFQQYTQALNLAPVVLHAPYLINLGSSDTTIWEKSITLLTWTLQRANALGARYVVFHTGSHKGAGLETGISRVAEGIKRILAHIPENGTLLLLENGVGAGHAFGNQFKHLESILDLLPAYQRQLGICIDTAHLWGAGYDISTRPDARQVLSQCEETFGLAQLHVIHLNDTEKALNSHRDVHARIGEGVIGIDGLSVFLQDPRLQHATTILETPIKLNAENKEDWQYEAHVIDQMKKIASQEAAN